MKTLKCLSIFSILTIFMLTFGCVGTEEVAKKDDPSPNIEETEPHDTEEDEGLNDDGEPPKTLAIFPFENNSVTDSERYAPLSKGLAAMLITDLSKTGETLKVIERDKIKALVEEITFSESGLVDESTAVKIGKILGSQSIAFGSFIVLGSQVRIDARIVNVETSEMIMAESIAGSSGDFMGLVSKLARKIAKSFKVALRSRAGSSQSSIDAALYFSKGLDALDRGERDAARELFNKCVSLDPAYKKQVDNVLNY